MVKIVLILGPFIECAGLFKALVKFSSFRRSYGLNQIFRGLASLLAEGAAVVLVSDYGKGVVIDAVVEAARASGAVVIVDPKGRDFARYGAVDLIKPNASELAGATGLPVEIAPTFDAVMFFGNAVLLTYALVVARRGG